MEKGVETNESVGLEKKLSKFDCYLRKDEVYEI